MLDSDTNSSNSSSRRLDTTNTTNTTNSTNSTNTTQVVDSNITVIILGKIDPYSNPEYTTDDLSGLDSTDLLALIQTILGTDYKVASVTAPNIIDIVLPNIKANYTATANTDSATISGLSVDNDGVVCYMLYPASVTASVSVSDINAGMAGGQPALDHACVPANVNSTNNIVINSLEDSTSYTLAYQVRSFDDRPYAETTTPNSLTITTQAISTGPTGSEEESQYIMIFGLLSFILLLIINAWSIDSWK